MTEIKMMIQRLKININNNNNDDNYKNNNLICEAPRQVTEMSQRKYGKKSKIERRLTHHSRQVLRHPRHRQCLFL